MKVPTIQELTKNMVEVGIISAEQLEKAQQIKQDTGENLGDILISEGFTTPDVFTAFIGKKSNLKYIDLKSFDKIDSKTLNRVPENFARKRDLIPVESKGNTLKVAVPDPMNIFITDDLRALTGMNIEIVLAVKDDIKAAIEKFYGSGFMEEVDTDESKKSNKKSNEPIDTSGVFSDIMQEFDADDLDINIIAADDDDKVTDISKIKKDSEGAPVVKMVNLLILTAIKRGASDIHIEPFEKTARIRYRVDGVLIPQPCPPKKVFNSIVARLKVMANVDLAEKRLPQDGRIKVTYGNKDIDLRASFLPTNFGEKVVMRILDSSNLCLDLSQLGFDKQEMAKFAKNIHAPNGIILVTGPTGSGKTTTLYSTLTTLNLPDVNISTIEDPVEYVLKGIIQVQANPSIGLTFAAGLRTFLRQDPDIIMVGEIRDKETAEIAINAAMTGHLVLATLHTNDAPTIVSRLANMEIEPFLISSTVRMALAQRLIRKICENCKESYEVDAEAMMSYGLDAEALDNQEKVTLYRGKGCTKCGDSGYKGRIGIYELMEVNENLKELINKKAPTNELRQSARQNGMNTLRESAIKKVFDGTTTIDEMLRVTAGDTG